MKIKILDTVVLQRDVPECALRKGDIGAVVEVYEPNGLEVEFVTGAGKTQALLTLTAQDVCPVGSSEILAARRVDAA